jgi:hypothetical protein
MGGKDIKYRPHPSNPDFSARQDAVPSDIDVLGINPSLEGAARVIAVNCKSWQSGFRPKSKITEIENNKVVSGREAWKAFRELTKIKSILQRGEAICGSNRYKTGCLT